VPYLSASAVVIHYEEALYQVYAPSHFTRPRALSKLRGKLDKTGWKNYHAMTRQTLTGVTSLIFCHPDKAKSTEAV